MVDWKNIGKKALDVTKDVTEKSVESFQEWKDDPKRIAKIEVKKAERKVKKTTETDRKKFLQLLKKSKPRLSVRIIAHVEKNYKKQLKLSSNGKVKITQNEMGFVYFSSNKEIFFELVSFEWKGPKINESQVTITKKKGTIGRAIVGGAIAGPLGSVVGASSAGSESETYTEIDESFSHGVITLNSIHNQDRLRVELALKEDQAIILKQMMDFVSTGDYSDQLNSEVEKLEIDSIEKIRKYKQLLDEGILTQEEFDEKKKQLLNLDHQEDNK